MVPRKKSIRYELEEWTIRLWFGDYKFQHWPIELRQVYVKCPRIACAVHFPVSSFPLLSCGCRSADQVDTFNLSQVRSFSCNKNSRLRRVPVFHQTLPTPDTILLLKPVAWVRSRCGRSKFWVHTGRRGALKMITSVGCLIWLRFIRFICTRFFQVLQPFCYWFAPLPRLPVVHFHPLKCIFLVQDLTDLTTWAP